ncbi:uncharacterized protein [Arachis hypogaea]|uniref:uncharacterized protein n=1 Tax=Arachis hypogaea TaxID=3818 RepID=UPI003B20B66F
MAHSKHIDKVLDRYSDETIANNRLRLKISIDAIRWLAFQACAFRGDDESPGSLNRGNFIELIKLLTLCNQNVNNVVLENAPGNAQYISPCPKKFAMFINSFQLTLIVNVVTVSPKRHDLLRVAQANNVANLNADDQLVTGSGLNQIGTLQRAGDTRWGSHLNSVRSLLCMFDATCEVLKKSTEEGNFSTRGDASAAYDAITSFEFVFVLHLMRNILEKRRTCKIVDQISVENHYRVNLFLAVIDTQLQELNGRFNDHMVELLTLSSTLDPRDNYKFFSVNKVLKNKSGYSEFYEGWKCVKYEVGLREDMRRAVAPLEIRRFSELVDNVRVVEEYVKTVASSRDIHGGNTSRERNDYLGPRGTELQERWTHSPASAKSRKI